MKRPLGRLAVVFGCAVALGCGGGKAPDGGATGALTVTLSGVLGGAPSVTVTGPDSYSKTLTATETLSGLAPGTYVLSAASLTVAGADISTVEDAMITGSPALVSAGQTAQATIAYTARPGSGQLWVVNAPESDVLSYAADLLLTTGSPAPTVGFGVPPGGGVVAIAFDSAGNLWAASPGAGVFRYAPASLKANGSPSPTAQVTASSPEYLTFDAHGNLWVADQDGTILRFKAADLVGSGALPASPDLTLNISGQTPWVQYVSGLAFDSSGDLWAPLSKFGSTPFSGVIDSFSAAQLQQTGSHTLTPAAIYASAQIMAGRGLAFDTHGNLWMTSPGNNGNNPQIIRYNAGSLTGMGTITTTPDLILTSSALNDPRSPAFDEGGNLWIANFGNNALLEFPASELFASGYITVSPTATLTGPGSYGCTCLAFDPAAAGLPLPR